MEGRPHAAYAVYGAARFWAVWLLPLVRLMQLPFGGNIRALWRDALPILAVCIWTVIRWRRCRYRVEETAGGEFHRLCIQQGVLIVRRLHVCADDAASVEVECTPLLRLLRCRRVRISTAGLRHRTDAVLYLSAAYTEQLFEKAERPRRFYGRLLSTLVLALSGSNAAVGILTMVPLLRQAGRVFDLSQAASNPLLEGVPPLMRLVANLLLMGWGVSVLLSFFRYFGFCAYREADDLHIAQGIFTRRDLHIDRYRVTGLWLRQTLMMRSFGLYGASITAAGYGRQLGARPVLVPAADEGLLHKELLRLMPSYPRTAVRVRARSVWRYVWAPLLLLTLAAGLTLCGWLWQPLSVLWLLLGSWWLLVRLLGRSQAGLGYTERGMALVYPYGLALYRVYLPSSVIDRLTVSQNPLERRRGICTVQVYTFGEKRRRHRLVGLPYDEVCTLVNNKKTALS